MIVDNLIFLTKSELRRIFSDQEYVFFNSLSEGGNRRNAECKLEGGVASAKTERVGRGGI